jgi:hypothetical protein
MESHRTLMGKLLVLLRPLYEVCQPSFWYSDLKAYSAETERCESVGVPLAIADWLKAYSRLVGGA